MKEKRVKDKPWHNNVNNYCTYNCTKQCLSMFQDELHKKKASSEVNVSSYKCKNCIISCISQFSNMHATISSFLPMFFTSYNIHQTQFVHSSHKSLKKLLLILCKILNKWLSSWVQSQSLIRS